MDLLLSSALLRYELWLGILSVGYVIFHIFYHFAAFCARIKRLITPSKIVREARLEDMPAPVTEVVSEGKTDSDIVTDQPVQTVASEVTESVLESAIASEASSEPVLLSKEQKDIVGEIVKAAKIKLSR